MMSVMLFPSGSRRGGTWHGLLPALTLLLCPLLLSPADADGQLIGLEDHLIALELRRPQVGAFRGAGFRVSLSEGIGLGPGQEVLP